MMLMPVDEPSTSSHFGGENPYKLQFIFDIPLFEVKIDTYCLELGFILLEGYFSSHFFNSKKIIFSLLNSPHDKK